MSHGRRGSSAGATRHAPPGACLRPQRTLAAPRGRDCLPRLAGAAPARGGPKGAAPQPRRTPQLVAGISPPCTPEPPCAGSEAVVRQSSAGSQAEYSDRDQTIIILDWDDTLCPTTWMNISRASTSCDQLAERFRRPLEELARQCADLLRAAAKLGKVAIITNASSPWVESSCKSILPSLHPVLLSVPVIYARSVYEAQRAAAGAGQSPHRQRPPSPLAAAAGVSQRWPKAAGAGLTRPADAHLDPQGWKEVAFAQEIQGFYSRYQHQSWKNVISIGDSFFEREAVRRVVPRRPCLEQRCRAKTLKLLERPRLEELTAQLRAVTKVLGAMVRHDGDLDIQVDLEDLHGEAHQLLQKVRRASAASGGGGGPGAPGS